MNTKAYEKITDRIIALLEQGSVPWRKTWKASTSWPRNFVTGKPYRGINVFLLVGLGYESPYWLTFRQAMRLGGSVKKGEKSSPVVFWKKTTIQDEETKEERKIPLLRFYHLFNAAQCENIGKTPANNGIVASLRMPAEIVAGMPTPPVIKHGLTRAYYSLPEDTVGMPSRENFGQGEDYYATLFHELVHSTGHEKRLKRQSLAENGGFGTDPYCREELVAEMGATFLCGQAEIAERTIDNSAAYIDSWLKQLKSDKTILVQAAAQAQKAADYILNVKSPPEGGEDGIKG